MHAAAPSADQKVEIPSQQREAAGSYGRLLRPGGEIDATGDRRLRGAMGSYFALEPKLRTPRPMLKNQAMTP